MNGGGPPDRVLQDVDYQVIKDGICITSGTYEGCIKVGEVHYWIYGNGEYWQLAQGEPERAQSKISSDIWDKCKNGGSLSWDDSADWWVDNGTYYRWAGYLGDPVELKEVD